jgi:hypothetical protein
MEFGLVNGSIKYLSPQHGICLYANAYMHVYMYVCMTPFTK